MKTEYPPLLASGFREIGLWQLDEWFLEPFPEKSRRRYLIDRLRAFIEELDSLNLDVEIWIDGSFVTRKPEPEDMDLVLFFEETAIAQLTRDQAKAFNQLLMDREATRRRFACDVYIADRNDQAARRYWQETFGRTKNQLGSKGIFKLIRHAGIRNRPN